MSSEQKPLTPEEQHARTQKGIDDARAQVAAELGENISTKISDSRATAPATPAAVASQMAASGIDSATLEDVIKKILDERKAQKIAEFIPKEPDYSTLSERDILRPDVYIPVIEHDIPEYMNVVLKDTEYLPIWVNRDQRQLGAKMAEGFEFLKREHLPDGYQPPLKFDSEGLYIYQDVVCMRVHKRIRFAKIRKFFEISKNQLRPAQAQENAKSTLMEKVILGDPALDQAFATGAYKFYHTDT